MFLAPCEMRWDLERLAPSDPPWSGGKKLRDWIKKYMEISLHLVSYEIPHGHEFLESLKFYIGNQMTEQARFT